MWSVLPISLATKMPGNFDIPHPHCSMYDKKTIYSFACPDLNNGKITRSIRLIRLIDAPKIGLGVRG